MAGPARTCFLRLYSRYAVLRICDGPDVTKKTSKSATGLLDSCAGGLATAGKFCEREPAVTNRYTQLQNHFQHSYTVDAFGSELLRFDAVGQPLTSLQARFALQARGRSVQPGSLLQLLENIGCVCHLCLGARMCSTGGLLPLQIC